MANRQNISLHRREMRENVPLTVDTMVCFFVVIFSGVNRLHRCWDNNSGDNVSWLQNFISQSSLLTKFVIFFSYLFIHPLTDIVNPSFNYSLSYSVSLTYPLSQSTHSLPCSLTQSSPDLIKIVNNQWNKWCSFLDPFDKKKCCFTSNNWRYQFPAHTRHEK